MPSNEPSTSTNAGNYGTAPGRPEWSAEVMLPRDWKTSRMMAHYSAVVTAARGAVAR